MDAGSRETAISLLSGLGEAHGAPGSEGELRRIIRKEIGGELTTDKTGSIISVKRGDAEKPRVMLAAHMDEVGFMVHVVTKSGLIKFVPLGGWWPHTLLAQRVRIRTRENRDITGVIGAKPPHFLTEAEREKLMKIDDMFIDVGATDFDDVRDRFGIRPGDFIVPDSGFTPLHNPDFLLCKAFDDRCGLALMTHIMRKLDETPHPNTVCGVGTVQEEVGMRGARTAAYSVNPDVAIVLEGSPADDLPSIPEEERQGVLGKGAQIRVMDPSAIMNPKLVRHTIKLAEENRIKHQIAVRKSGGTDAHAIHLHGFGVPTIVIGTPVRYIHTHNTIINIEDYLSALDLVLKLLESLDEATVNGFTVCEE